MRTCRLLAVLALLLGGVPAWAQTPVSRPALPAAQNTPGGPAWRDLTPQQREALAPLQSDWAGLDETRKRKWLEMAARYPSLSPEGKQRFHERMVPYARMTPEQRSTARENFQRAYTLPADQRKSAVQHYQELPPESRRELADKAAARKAQEAPRPTAPPPAKASGRSAEPAPAKK